MDTVLFDDIVFGPISSRRLGRSLGVNLLSTHAKVCNYDCIYCECGWSGRNLPANKYANIDELFEALSDRLQELALKGKKIDHITFAGNGEPTLHPRFGQAITATSWLRDRWAPDADIAVLSNATTLGKASIREAFDLVDKKIFKLDAGAETTFQLINSPLGKVTLQDTCQNIKQLFGKQAIIQSLFLKGNYNGRVVDNTQDDEVSQWLAMLEEIQPKGVMIYSIDRATPLKTLQKIPIASLHAIAERVKALGLKTYVYS